MLTRVLRRIVAVVRGDSNIKGTVTFEQEAENSLTTVSWDITGHDANAKRGMHIHTFGDNTNGCTSAGPHCQFIHHQRASSRKSANQTTSCSQPSRNHTR
jgi:Cu/Zn superoxide dismutase